ncbi:hypothetical protein M885DRAFT_506985 [Pelagophyceae sp. CCMP2097]|nr:hypothetical protein M885DRAFT_506985 [Pelagophyceae sp. CCMP2097]
MLCCCARGARVIAGDVEAGPTSPSSKSARSADDEPTHPWSYFGCCHRCRRRAAYEAKAEAKAEAFREEDDSSEEEQDEVVAEPRCCCGLLREVPPEERDVVLLGGLVEVSEDLREFGFDGRVLAIQESNVFLAAILTVVLVDLVVTVLFMECPAAAACAVFPELKSNSAVDAFGNCTLAIFAVEIFVRLRQFKICRSYRAFFTDFFCILDFGLVSIDLAIIALNLALASLVDQYHFLGPVGQFASNGRILRAVRIFRMLRAVRAARAVAALSKNQDLFSAAAAGNLAEVSKRAGPAAKGASAFAGKLQRLDAERASLWRRNTFGETALHVAAAGGRDRVVKYLLERESCETPDPRDWTTGATPLWNACLAAKRTTARVLLSKGADLDLAPLFGEHRGVTAKELAMARHWSDLIDEAVVIRKAETKRVRLREERRARRRDRVSLERAAAYRAAAEETEAERLADVARLECARLKVRRRVDIYLQSGLRHTFKKWRGNVFDQDEVEAAGTSRGKALAVRARQRRLDAARLERDPAERRRRERKAKDNKREATAARAAAAAQRTLANSTRLAWRDEAGAAKKRPELTPNEAALRMLRATAAARDGAPQAALSVRLQADGTRPRTASLLVGGNSRASLLAQTPTARPRTAS